MRELLSPEGPVMNLITRIVYSVWLNILWFVFSIPIVTIGASTTALFYVSLKLARNEEGNVTEQFVKAFRTNFRYATKVWGILLGAGLILGLDGYVLLRLRFENVFWTIISAIYIVALIGYLIILMYVFPLMARFDNTIFQTLKNSLFIGLHFLLCTVFMAAIYFLMALIVIRIFTPAIIFGEGLCAFLCSFLLAPLLQRLVDGGKKDQEGDDSGEDNGSEDADDKTEIGPRTVPDNTAE